MSDGGDDDRAPVDTPGVGEADDENDTGDGDPGSVTDAVSFDGVEGIASVDDGTDSSAPALDSGTENGAAGTASESSDADRAGPVGDEPLADLADGVRGRRDGEDGDGGLFEREEVAGIDGDALWDRIEGGDEFDAAALTDREIRTVSKRSYCQGCEHFAAPPDVECTHEGTDVLEMPALDSFRVADCPVVLEEERLERGE